MYLIVIHVPIYRQADALLVSTDWLRSIELLRDSFDGHFGNVHILAPSLPVDAAPPDAVLERADRLEDVELTPSIDRRIRARHYWLSGRRQWLADVRRLAAQADVMHSGFVDPIRPLMYDALKVAFAVNRPTVAYRDTDTLEQFRGARKTATAPERAMLSVRAVLFARMARHVARSVDLLMLKGQSLMKWLGPYARRVHSFQDTSYLESEMVTADVVAKRAATLTNGRPLRLVYCGRLVEYKGLNLAIDIIDHAGCQGARLSFDLIGDGPQRPALEAIVNRRGLTERIRFLGSCVYGPSLLQRLAAYDALLFTPLVEDTPRMIFDGYAAGLPLIGSDVRYVRERDAEDHATVLLPQDDRAAATAKLISLANDPRPLVELALRAHDAGKTHAADRWYKRRAEWTIEAVEAHASTQVRSSHPGTSC